MKRLIAGSARRTSRTGRYLRVEPLESRAMLSAISPLPHGGIAAEPLTESVPALVAGDAAAVERDVAIAPRTFVTAWNGVSIDGSTLSSPVQLDGEFLRDVEAVVAASDLRLPFPMDAGSRLVTRGEAAFDGSRSLDIKPIDGEFSVTSLSRWEFPDDLKLDGASDELSALVAGGNRRDMAVSQEGNVDLRPDGAPEGGFIMLGNPVHVGEEIRLDQFRAMDGQTFASRQLRPLAQITAMDEVGSESEVAVPLSSAAEVGTELGTLTLDSDENSAEMHSHEENSAASLSDFEAVDGKIPAGSAAGQSAATVRVDADVKQQLETEVAREADPADDAVLRSELPRLDESLIRTRFSNPDSEVDGLPVVAEGSEQPASHSERRLSEEELLRSAAASIPSDVSEATESRDTAGQFDERASETAADTGAASDVAGELSRWAFGLEEGGTIDLVAAAFLRQQDGGTVAAPTVEQPSIGAQDVRMDKAIGLFQAFELSTAPTERAGQITLTSASAGEQQLFAPLDAAASDTRVVPAVRRVSEAARKESDERPDSHRAALPSVVVAFLLSAAGRRFREDGSTEWKWLRLSD